MGKSKQHTSITSESSSSSGGSEDYSSDYSSNYSSDSSDNDYSTNGDELIGDVLNNQYILLHKIGFGSFSSVWLTYDIVHDAFFAIKIQTPDDYEEGIREIQIYEMINNISKQNKSVDSLMLLKSSFVLVKEDKKYVCMVMELMAGSLYDLIKIDKYTSGLPEEVVNKIQIQMMEGLNILHNFDIIHADIKPENVLVCGINKKYQKVIDKFKKLKLKEKYDQNIIEIQKQYNLNNKKHKKKYKSDKYYVLLELNKFIHNIIDFDKILEDDRSNNFLNDTNIDDIKVKISDFGSILFERELKKEKYYPEITTRYYRDPKVVLGMKYDKAIDLHAIKCTLHEIKTGQILYNPDLLRDNDNENRYSVDYYHVILFMKDGLIKPEWIKSCKKEELKQELKNLISV